MVTPRPSGNLASLANDTERFIILAPGCGGLLFKEPHHEWTINREQIGGLSVG